MSRCLLTVILLLSSWRVEATPASQPAAAPTATPVTSAPSPASSDDDDDIVEEVGEVQVVKKGDHALFFGEGYPRRDRFVNLHSAHVTRRHALRMIIDHRTNKSVSENSFHDFFGFDAGSLKIGLGLRFGVAEGFDVGIYRLNGATERFDIYEFDVKARLLRADAHFVNLALRAGISWFSQQNAEDSVGFLGQLLLSRRLGKRFNIGAGLLFHSDSTNGVKSNLDDQWSLATQIALDFRALSWLAWDLEIAYALAGYTTRDTVGVTAWPSFSSALAFVTNRHTFALVVSNNPYLSADGVVTNSPRGFDELVIGFSITREWNF